MLSKKTNPHRLHTMIIPQILHCEVTNLQKWRLDKWLPGVIREGGQTVVGVAVKGQHVGISVVGTVLYLDYINVNILVVTFYYGFVMYFHVGKLCKGSMGDLCITCYNFMWIYNYLKIKRLVKILKGWSKSHSRKICITGYELYFHQ